MARYQYRRFGATPLQWPVSPSDLAKQIVIVGAGPVGLCAAIDLALRGVACVVVDDNDTVSVGSRAICWSKRTLEIFDRLGVGDRVLEKGVTWNVGRLFHRDQEVWSFDLLPEDGHKMPAFVNLQQYYVEEFLVDRAREFPELIDLRFKHKVVGVSSTSSGAELQIEVDGEDYRLRTEWVIACDGARSFVRSDLGLGFRGHLFEERLLIADVEMKADFPSERWFWFEPPFHNGQSALLHKQPDNIYRIDLQLGPDADPEKEKLPEKVCRRIAAMVGPREFELDWVSVYNFQCSRLESFVHDRIIFAGDSAHVVSPFGARGGNGGIQDVDNICWKLASIVQGESKQSLITSYDDERVRAADENITNSSRATNFMSPKSAMDRIFRDEVLNLAEKMPFARRLVNSGRLSQPCSLAGLPLQTPCSTAVLQPGSPCPDAPLKRGGEAIWLLNLLGRGFVLLSIGHSPKINISGVQHIIVALDDSGTIRDETGHAYHRYGEGWSYLIRPDQHVAAAFASPDHGEVLTALHRASAAAGGKDV
jgi:3-(3-hydroxy-phenyl)propionate hydroxylase